MSTNYPIEDYITLTWKSCKHFSFFSLLVIYHLFSFSSLLVIYHLLWCRVKSLQTLWWTWIEVIEVLANTDVEFLIYLKYGWSSEVKWIMSHISCSPYMDDSCAIKWLSCRSGMLTSHSIKSFLSLNWGNVSSKINSRWLRNRIREVRKNKIYFSYPK